MRFRNLFWVAVVLCISAAGVLQAETSTAPPTSVTAPQGTRFLSWITYFRGPHGENDLVRSKKALDDLSIFALQFGPDGALMPASPWVQKMIAKFAASPPPATQIWLTVVNDYKQGKANSLKDPGIVHEKLATADARTAHINELLPWSRDVSGLEIDYENLHQEDAEAFSLFIEELAQKLHAEGKRLSVTLEPKTNGDTGNSPGLDWKRMGAAADQVRVMAYFYSYPGGAPGPIAPLAWLSSVAQYARSQIPLEKLTVVLTVNGIDWPVGQRGRPIRYHTVVSLIAYENAKPQRDPVNQTPYLRYQSGKETHEVWYEDAASLQAKLERLRQDGILSIGFWMLGTGDPAFWGRLGGLKK